METNDHIPRNYNENSPLIPTNGNNSNNVSIERSDETFKQLLRLAFDENKRRFYTISRLFNGLALVGAYTVAWSQLPSTEAFLTLRKLALFLLLVITGLITASEEAGCRFFFLNILQQNPSYWRSSYFSARLIAEGLLLLSFLLPQFIAIYWLMGLARSAAGFSLYLSFTLLCSLNSQSLGRLCGMLPKLTIGDTVNITSAIMIVVTFLTGFIWFADSAKHDIMYLSYQFYAYHGLLQAEFLVGGTQIQCAPPSASIFRDCNANLTTQITGEMVMTKVWATPPPIWANFLILLGFYILFNGLAFALLCMLIPGKRSPASKQLANEERANGTSRTSDPQQNHVSTVCKCDGKHIQIL